MPTRSVWDFAFRLSPFARRGRRDRMRDAVGAGERRRGIGAQFQPLRELRQPPT